MTSIVLATGNKGKVKELASLLEQYNIDIKPQSEFNVGDVEETGTTFVENAIIKARHASKITGLPAIADDSGLEVDALNGAPGVYSARYAGIDASDKDNTNKLLNALKNTPEAQRTARFHCVLVFMRHQDDPTPIICHGVWQGSIITEKLGEQGFGYDPIFWQEEYQMTAAQMPRELKNSISHRGQALNALLAKLANITIKNTGI